MDWPESEVFKLINLFKQYPCLWDIQNPFYKRVDRKKVAWEKIAAVMRKTVEIVRKKMKNLRSAYLFEKKKVESLKNSGSPEGEVYTPHLYYYSEMHFLDRAICLRQFSNSFTTSEDQDNLELSPVTKVEENTEFSDTYDSNVYYISEPQDNDMPISSQKATYSCKKRKLNRDQKISDALDGIISKTNEVSDKETMFSCFGKSVGLQLERVPLSAAVEVMADIQRLLSDAIIKNDPLM